MLNKQELNVESQPQALNPWPAAAELPVEYAQIIWSQVDFYL